MYGMVRYLYGRMASEARRNTETAGLNGIKKNAKLAL
jgi:hypothetical protein